MFATAGERLGVAGGSLTFEGFFEETHQRLFAALCLATGNRYEAEEIMQDAFLALWQRWENVSAMDDPTGYLFRTAMNLFRKRLRRAAVAARRTLALAPREDAFEAIDEQDALMRAMRGLSPRERTAVVLTAILGFSSQEAGKILGVKDSTVRVLAKRAREAMRPMVGEVT
jgi:RNA polymerase sigma-70 factor, ECF subfamily